MRRARFERSFCAVQTVITEDSYKIMRLINLCVHLWLDSTLAGDSTAHTKSHTCFRKCCLYKDKCSYKSMIYSVCSTYYLNPWPNPRSPDPILMIFHFQCCCCSPLKFHDFQEAKYWQFGPIQAFFWRSIAFCDTSSSARDASTSWRKIA